MGLQRNHRSYPAGAYLLQCCTGWSNWQASWTAARIHTACDFENQGTTVLHLELGDCWLTWIRVDLYRFQAVLKCNWPLSQQKWTAFQTELGTSPGITPILVQLQATSRVGILTLISTPHRYWLLTWILSLRTMSENLIGKKSAFWGSVIVDSSDITLWSKFKHCVTQLHAKQLQVLVPGI